MTATYPRRLWGVAMEYQILIVDDSPPIRKCIRTFIEQRTDWKVCGEAENGRMAIEKANDLNPDVVILDMCMPVMNGLDAARQIRKTLPKLPVILFTMYISEELSEKAKAVGINGILSKEAGLDNLLVSISAVLKPTSIVRCGQTY
jgi:NarL family two-component system response regulator YdfI